MTATVSDPLARSFERHLRASNRPAATVRNYLDSIRQTEASLASRGRTLASATRDDVEAFFIDRLSRRSAETVAQRYKHLKVLYRWLEEEEEIEQSPMARIKPPIIPEQPVPVVPADALRRLLATCNGKHLTARRDTAIILMLVDTGMRASELIGLKVDDLDLDLNLLALPGSM